MKAIVTGHTKGLGAAIARTLLLRGIPVLGLARGKSAELAREFPGLFTQVELDLSDGTALAAWLAGNGVGNYLARCGTALLVNNAGVVTPVGPLHEQEPASVLQAVSLNVGAALALSAAVTKACPGGQKRILHISSGAGRSPYQGWSVYCATKAALDMHAQAVALDKNDDVRICSLAPGVIDTQMQARIRATPEELFPMRQRFVQMKESGALTSPDDAAKAVVAYLLAPEFGRRAVDDVRR